MPPPARREQLKARRDWVCGEAILKIEKGLFFNKMGKNKLVAIIYVSR